METNPSAEGDTFVTPARRCRASGSASFEGEEPTPSLKTESTGSAGDDIALDDGLTTGCSESSSDVDLPDFAYDLEARKDACVSCFRLWDKSQSVVPRRERGLECKDCSNLLPGLFPVRSSTASKEKRFAGTPSFELESSPTISSQVGSMS